MAGDGDYTHPAWSKLSDLLRLDIGISLDTSPELFLPDIMHIGLTGLYSGTTERHTVAQDVLCNAIAVLADSAGETQAARLREIHEKVRLLFNGICSQMSGGVSSWYQCCLMSSCWRPRVQVRQPLRPQYICYSSRAHTTYQMSRPPGMHDGSRWRRQSLSNAILCCKNDIWSYYGYLAVTSTMTFSISWFRAYVTHCKTRIRP